MAKMKIELLVESVSNEENKLLTKQVSRIIAETIDSTRTLTFEISPPVLYELGFEAAVEWLLRKSRKQHGLTTSFQTDGRNKPLDGNVRVFLFQAVRELLINVSKHSGAKKVIVSVFRLNNHVQVSVADNGKGFNMEKLNSLTPNPSGFGLFSIKERLSYIGGKLNIDSAKGKGARIIMTAPLAIEQRDTGG
jgi:signal transduction histidine kinase